MKLMQKVVETKNSQMVFLVKDEIANGWNVQCLFADPTDRASFVVFSKPGEEGVAGDPAMLNTPDDIDEDEAEPTMKPREPAPWITTQKKRKK